MKYIDLHTHQPTANPEVLFVYNLRAGSQRPADLRGPYSYGLHPWDSMQRELIELIIQLKTDNQLFFIGECGLDKFRGAALTAQKQILEIQLRKAEELKRPVLLHCVGCHNELLQMKQAFHPQQYWVLHGFRGHPRLAEQLLRPASSFPLALPCSKKEERPVNPCRFCHRAPGFWKATTAHCPYRKYIGKRPPCFTAKKQS